MQVEAAKVAKVREAAITKLKSLEKQKAEVEKTRDDIKYDPVLPPRHLPLPRTLLFLPSLHHCLPTVAHPPLPLSSPILAPSC